MAWLEIMNFVHFVGLAFGLGGATIATIISSKSSKDPAVAAASMKLMPSISKLIGFGLLLLIISGIILPSLISWPLDKQMLIVKHVLVAWVVVFGIIIGVNSKKVSRLAPGKKEEPSKKFIMARKRIKAFSIINLILWYLITLMSAFV